MATPATAAIIALKSPSGVVVNATTGNVYIADTGNNVIRVVPGKTANGLTAGDIYTFAGNGIAGYSGDGGLATLAELKGPVGLAIQFFWAT